METPIIQIQNLRKAYAKPVLRGIDLTVNKASIIGYLGPNGAGKSTTIKILTGLISDYEGTVHVLGYDLRKDSMEVKRRIGYIPEQAALYEVLSPLEFLQFVGQLYGLAEANIYTKSMELLKIFGLEGHAKQRMTTFSKGMRQKVLIISGLLHNPEIIFLDEPLNGLDANAVILMKEVLSQLAQAGKTIFYSSHIMDVVEKLADRIIILNEGRMIADGTFEALQHSQHRGSLEQIFTNLTGDASHTAQATQLLDILKTSTGAS